MAERGISVDHATVHRWVVRDAPELLKRFNARKRTVTGKWHVDETYIKVRGRWMSLYRAIDSNGDTVEFWFSERRTSLRPSSFCARRSSGMADPRGSSSTAARPTGKRSCRVMPRAGCRTFQDAGSSRSGSGKAPASIIVSSRIIGLSSGGLAR